MIGKMAGAAMDYATLWVAFALWLDHKVPFCAGLLITWATFITWCTVWAFIFFLARQQAHLQN